MDTTKKISYLILLVVLVIIGAVLLGMEGVDLGSIGSSLMTPGADWALQEETQFGKNLDVWFMLMLVAFLMIFIKKYEWGVALAVLLSAAASFVVYLGIQDFYFDAAWNQGLLIRAVVCAITLVIAIGVFLGTVKMWQYLLVGVAFAHARRLHRRRCDGEGPRRLHTGPHVRGLLRSRMRSRNQREARVRRTHVHHHSQRHVRLAGKHAAVDALALLRDLPARTRVRHLGNRDLLHGRNRIRHQRVSRVHVLPGQGQPADVHLRNAVRTRRHRSTPAVRRTLGSPAESSPVPSRPCASSTCSPGSARSSVCSM